MDNYSANYRQTRFEVLCPGKCKEIKIPKVNLKFFEVTVHHEQRSWVKKRDIQLHLSESFYDFQVRIRIAFLADIETKMFRLYSSAHGASVTNRVLIDSEDGFQNCVQLLLDPQNFHPNLIIHDFEEK